MDPAQEGNLSHEDPQVPKESLFTRLFPKLAQFHLPSGNVPAILIPVVIVLIVLLAGGGGTYMVAANFLAPKTPNRIASDITNDFDEILATRPTVPPPTATPTPTKAAVAKVTPTATPTPSATANWISYTFSPVNLNFSYPPGWYTNVINTSGPPYMYVQNFSPSATLPTNTQGLYALQIARFAQVGITTVDGLTAQLAINDANNVYINNINMGYPTVVSSGVETVNGYASYFRTVTYTNSPFTQVFQQYVLDGVSNVVVFTPSYDTTYGNSYFETLLSTISFN